MAAYRSPSVPPENLPLVPLATRFYSKHRRQEFEGWREPQRASSPSLGLSVGRPFYMTDRGLYNSQPRYPHSRSMRSGVILPQLRKQGSMLSVPRLRQSSVDLDFGSDESEVALGSPSQSTVYPVGGRHRKRLGPLLFSSEGLLSNAQLRSSVALQRVARSSSTPEVESEKCRFPRPEAARGRSAWDAEVVNERTMWRRCRLPRIAPEILFQGPPPRVRRKRGAVSSLSTTAVGEEQKPSSASKQGGEDNETDSASELSADFSDAACQYATSECESIEPSTRRVASGRLEGRKSSAETTRRVTSEKATCRWPAHLLEEKPKHRTRVPNAEVSPSGMVTEGRKGKKRKAGQVRMNAESGGEVEPVASSQGDAGIEYSESEESAEESGVEIARECVWEIVEGAQGVVGKPEAFVPKKRGKVRREMTVKREVPESLSTAVPRDSQDSEFSDSPVGELDRAPTGRKELVYKMKSVSRKDSVGRSDSESRMESQSGMHLESGSDQEHRGTDWEAQRESPEQLKGKPPVRKRSLTSMARHTDMNLSSRSSSAIEERPDTEDLSEVGESSSVSRRLRLARTRVREKTLRSSSPSASPTRMDSSPGRRLLLRERQFSAEDWSLVNSHRVSGKSSARDSDRSCNGASSVAGMRPSTGMRTVEPRLNLHPLRKDSASRSDRSPPVDAPTIQPELQEGETEDFSARLAGDQADVSELKPAEGEQSEGRTPLDDLVFNISSSVLTIINRLMTLDPSKLRTKLAPVLGSTNVNSRVRRKEPIKTEVNSGVSKPEMSLRTEPRFDSRPEPVRRPEPSSDLSPETAFRADIQRRKPAESKSGSPPKPAKPKKPLSLTTKAVVGNTKRVVSKPKPRRQQRVKNSDRSSSESSVYSDDQGLEPESPEPPQFRMAEFQLRQLSFIHKLAEDLLTGAKETDAQGEEPQKVVFTDSDSEEFYHASHNKGVDVHRRIQSMFELMRLPVQNVFTVAIEKELRMRPPPSRETILPEEVIVDRKNREEARLTQKFYAKLSFLPTHDTLEEKQEGTLFQLDHHFSPRDAKEYYLRLSRLKRQKQRAKLSAREEFTFSNLELKYYLRKHALRHPRKRIVLPPVRSRCEDLYEERIYGRLKNDPDEIIFPRKTKRGLKSLEASLEELEQVSKFESTHRTSL